MNSRPDPRAPLNPTVVRSALTDPGRFDIRHVLCTGSTNADLAAITRKDGERAGLPWPVLVTEEQVAGRGRSGRNWICPPGAGLMFSVRVPLTHVPAARRGWTGAVLGLAALGALAGLTGSAEERSGPTPDQPSAPVRPVPRLKWPNDLLIGDRKCAGILAEAAGAEVIVGIGLNVSVTAAELPRPDATSLHLGGWPAVDRDVLLAGILDRFGGWIDQWCAAGGDVDRSGVRGAYLAACGTLNRAVRVELPGGRTVTGVAVDIDPAGAIVVRGADGKLQWFSAGDVVHLRATGAEPRARANPFARD